MNDVRQGIADGVKSSLSLIMTVGGSVFMLLVIWLAFSHFDTYSLRSPLPRNWTWSGLATWFSIAITRAPLALISLFVIGLFIANGIGWVLYLGVALLRAIGGYRGPQPRSAIDEAAYMIIASAMIVGMAPCAVLSLDFLVGHQLFESGCVVRSLDYWYFAVDELAKGALGDVLESFNIDFYRCKPGRNAYASFNRLFLRTVSSAVIIWSFVHWWKYHVNNERWRMQ